MYEIHLERQSKQEKIEKQMGLPKGSIKQATFDVEEGITLLFDKEPTAEQKTILEVSTGHEITEEKIVKEK